MTLITLDFSDNLLEEEILKDGRWKKLPVDETVKILFYEDEYSPLRNPRLSDDDNQPFFPKVEEGYYLFIDRHSQKDEIPNVFDRYSFNFIFALYDSHKDILYYCKYDT